MIRLFDFLFSSLGLIILLPIFFFIYFIVLFKDGSPFFRQWRLGQNQKLFLLIKFRTMKIETKSVATHLVDQSMITSLGYFLRRTKIDEVPQLVNVLLGDMSLVGPRPCLENQIELINERNKRGVFRIKPGITGLAQISEITMETPILLAEADYKMMNQMNLYNYFYYIFQTLLLIIRKKED